MSEVGRIVDQLGRTFDGDAWYGPALRPLLDEFAAVAAAAHPLPHRHSAWELTLHAAANIDWVRQRLRGATVELTRDEDWPPVRDVSEATWARARATLDASYADLLALTRALDDAQLAVTVPGRTYSVYVMLHGIVQHNVYHAGQIALLRPAGESNRPLSP